MNYAKSLPICGSNPLRRYRPISRIVICLFVSFFFIFSLYKGRSQERGPLKLEMFESFVRDRGIPLDEIIKIVRDLGVGFDVDQKLETSVEQIRGENSRAFLVELKMLRRKTLRISSMVRIPEGKLSMGSEEQVDAMPVHEIAVSPFYLDKHEVTNSEYLKFLEYMNSNGDHSRCHQDEPSNKNHTPAYLKDAALNAADQPVVGVDWYDAYAFAAWSGVRLPTETEWEWAARGGLVGQSFPWGADPPDGEAHYNKLTSGPKSVGSFPPNGFGLLDMAGNVWELTDSFHDDGYHFYVWLRGGSYFFAKGSHWYMQGGPVPVYQRAKFLLMSPSLNRCATIGFRCVKIAE